MKKDLLIGYASNYDKSVLCFWINSIRKTDFKGDVAILGSNLTEETIHYIQSKKVKIFQHENIMDNSVPHVERFLYLYLFLKKYIDKYENVISTDTKDVIFQSNPSLWLKENLNTKKLIVSSECLKYKDEPWNDQNLMETFGQLTYEEMKNFTIYNVGVIAGKIVDVMELFKFIFYLSQNRTVQIVDQAVFNFIIQTETVGNKTLFTSNRDKWAVNLAVCNDAVRIGSGHVGQKCANNMKFYSEYRKNYMDDQPIFDRKGTVKSKDGTPFVIVHQWNRIPGFNGIDNLKEKIMKKFGD